MNFISHHINQVLTSYQGETPLAIALKKYFKLYPQAGSRDRKVVTDACYLYFRFAFLFKKTTPWQTVLLYAIKSRNTNNSFLENKINKIDDKAKHEAHTYEDVRLPELSFNFTPYQWLQSLHDQPNVFIRIRKNAKEVIKILMNENIDFEQVEFHSSPSIKTQICLTIPNTSSLDKILPADTYTVQDYNSQLSVYNFLDYISKIRAKTPNKVWDTCSGAGGKSLLLSDLYPSLRIFASDVRNTILHNLKMRFKLYSKNIPEIQVLNLNNLSDLKNKVKNEIFDIIICDVPCSGSGTWARTPEAFHFFNQQKLIDFHQLQSNILKNAASYLSPDGILVYITCSVFKLENEAVTEKAAKEANMKIVDTKLLNGVKNKADSIFTAILTK